MTRLVAGMFDRYEGESIFGIRFGQIRGHDFVHNGGWFGPDGAILGLGDLDLHDIARIRDGLQPGESFIILGEHDSHESRWNPDWNNGERWKRGSSAMTGPGVDYIAQHARYAIFPGETYMIVHRFLMDRDGEKHYTATAGGWRAASYQEEAPRFQVTFKYLSHEELRHKL